MNIEDSSIENVLSAVMNELGVKNTPGLGRLDKGIGYKLSA